MYTTFSRRGVACICTYTILYIDWRLGLLILCTTLADDIYMNGF